MARCIFAKMSQPVTGVRVKPDEVVQAHVSSHVWADAGLAGIHVLRRGIFVF